MKIATSDMKVLRSVAKKWAVGELPTLEKFYETVAFDTFDESNGDHPIAKEARELWEVERLGRPLRSQPTYFKGLTMKQMSRIKKHKDVVKEITDKSEGKCEECNGEGRVLVYDAHPDWVNSGFALCTNCRGTGKK